MNMYLLGIASGILLSILGHLVAFWRLKWKIKAGRKTHLANLRIPIYAEALALVYSIENNRGNADALHAAINGLKDWIPAKATYLPPQGNAAIFGIISFGTAYWCDLQNRQTDAETRRIFQENLQTAKRFFMENRDIGWLPKDLE